MQARAQGRSWTSIVYCRDCARWDSENHRCQDGKVNPPSWEQTVNVANVLGVRSICIFNDYRERLVCSRLPQGKIEAPAKKSKPRRKSA